MKKVFRFNALPFVPNRFIWAFAISLISFYAFMESNFILLGLSIILVPVCVTSQYMVELNIEEKWFNEFIWIMGFKSGKPTRYNTLDYLFIIRGKVTQTTGSRVQSTTVTKDEYRGFIKFDGNEKIHILTNNNYDALVKIMTETAKSLNAPLMDYSSGQGIQLV